MKDKILAALKKRFAAIGVEESLLERFATKLAVTVTAEDAIEAAVQAVNFKQLVQSEVDSKITTSNKKAVDNAQSKIIADAFKAKGLDAEGKPIEKVEEKKLGDGDDIPAYMKQFMADQKKTIDDLKTEISTNKTEMVQTDLKSKVTNKLDELKVPKSYYTDLSIEITDPEKVSDVANAVLGKYNTFKQDLVNQNLMFEKPQQKTLDVEESDIEEYLDEKFPKKTEK